METGTQRTIVALAILKTNWEHLGKDYLENFVPFVVECAGRAPTEIIVLPELQAQVLDSFGIHLPQNALRHVIQRAAKAGYVRKEDGIFKRNTEKCAAMDLFRRREDIFQEYGRVAARLAGFAQENHDLQWTTEVAEEQILQFLSGRGLDLLFGVAAPIAAGQSGQRNRFVTASFIDWTRQHDVDTFSAIENLAKGKLLADALYLAEPGKTRQKFKNTRVYLDSQLVIFLCGYAGEAREAPRKELHSLLRAARADVYCFRATVEEINGILNASAIGLRPGNRETAYGLTFEHFLASGMSSSDVDLVRAKFPDKLRSLGIKIDDRPPFDREFNVDEGGFEKYLEANLRYPRKEPLIHDLDCIAAIARLRRGRESYSVETSHALFVTTNSALSRASRDFFQNESPPGAVPLCLTDHALGNLLWLKDPTVAPELPALRLLADAYAAMEPPAGLWTRYLSEIKRLHEHGDVTADEYYLLRYSIGAKAALIQLTDGSGDGFSEGTVSEILEVARGNLRRDLEEEVVVTQAENALLRGRESRRLEHRQRIARSVGTFVGRTAFGVVMIVLTLGLIYTFPWSLPRFESEVWRYFVFGSLLLLIGYMVLSMATGATVRDVTRQVGRWVERRVMRVLGWFDGGATGRPLQTGTDSATSHRPKAPPP